MANAKTSAVLSEKQITQSIFFVKHANWRHRAFPGFRDLAFSHGRLFFKARGFFIHGVTLMIDGDGLEFRRIDRRHDLQETFAHLRDDDLQAKLEHETGKELGLYVLDVSDF